jgi:hypothetical protein
MALSHSKSPQKNPGYKRGNFALFLTDVFTLISDPIGQTLGMAGLPSQRPHSPKTTTTLSLPAQLQELCQHQQWSFFFFFSICNNILSNLQSRNQFTVVQFKQFSFDLVHVKDAYNLASSPGMFEVLANSVHLLFVTYYNHIPHTRNINTRAILQSSAGPPLP